MKFVDDDDDDDDDDLCGRPAIATYGRANSNRFFVAARRAVESPVYGTETHELDRLFRRHLKAFNSLSPISMRA